MSSVGQQLLRGSFLQVAFYRFASPELLDFVRRWKIDLTQVESLKRTSAKIQALYDEAEVKQFSSDAVKLWLDPVKQLLYDAEDVLDEFATELLRLKLESSKYQTLPRQTQQCGRESAVEGIDEMVKAFGSKVRDLNERLQSEAKEGVALGLNLSMLGSGSSRTRVISQQRPQTSSLVKRSEVFGREDDKWKIIKWLLSEKKTASASNSDNNFSVLPIVGMGGAGKTTLAQLVYNDESVERHFQLKAWVCVSENFDELRITKEILDSATGSSPSSGSLDTLQKKLKETLNRKRFLLVLDDMWNEDYERWCALRTPFAFGETGSKILVTTRNKRVSSIVRTDPEDQDHDVKVLSDEACLDIVRRHAFIIGNSSDAEQKLEFFGQEIVEKCKGLPLAVKTLSGLLRDKSENCEWEEILESEIWDLGENGILPSLMLSYHHLPPLLKRCFQYCALFPKDYVFGKFELVMLWMAEGIVHPERNKRLEDTGARYFDELLFRSFFELSSDRDPSNRALSTYFIFNECERSFFDSFSNSRSGYVMHDLIHDLAQFVSGGIHCRREEYDNKSFEVCSATRHLSSLTKHFNVVETEPEAINSLRTIIDLSYTFNLSYTINDLPIHRIPIQFPFQIQVQFMRVLLFRDFCNRELPASIGNLKHLRLLDLSYSSIVRLPDSITSLYNLQTLILYRCERLVKLPGDIGNLINLRYLVLPRSDYFYEMPLGVGNLTRLQTLNTFMVGSKNGSDLRNLSQLRGSLDISNLENLGNINGREAVVANLKNKPHLRKLQLCWSYYESEESFPYLWRDEKVEEDVLDQLQPHTNLETLLIINYGGTRFPSWMEHPSFSKLETLSLISCHKCRFLPHLQQLPLLKHLEIRGCGAKKMVGSELCRDGSSSSSSFNKQFRSLERLTIRDMKEWEEWSEVVEADEGGGQFPCLHVLIIYNCPKLRMLSLCFPNLEKLYIHNCYNLESLPKELHTITSLQEIFFECCYALVSFHETRLPFSLQKLEIRHCNNLESLPKELHTVSCLQKFVIGWCSTFVSFQETKLPTALQKLEISDCKNLESLPKELHTIVSLQEILIERCPALLSFQETKLPTALQKLEIKYCQNLASLPKELHTVTSLQIFVIERCDALVSFHETRLPFALQKLEIRDCKNLESLPKELHTVTSLQEFVIRRCNALVSFRETNLPMGLQKLEINYCDNLESLPKELHTVTSLQEILIEWCPALVSFQDTKLPTTVSKLEIKFCQNLESLPKELHTVTSLQKFVIRKCDAIVSFQETGFPTALQYLEISCMNLESLPKELHTLTSLQEFVISCCALVSFQETKLPISLQRLEITHCHNLESLPNELHTLTSLQNFVIRSCSALVSFQETKLPIGLQRLEITYCNNLESLPNELHTVTSLQEFVISSCDALVSFRETNLPMGLKKLEITDCKHLESLPKELHTVTSLQGIFIERCPALVPFWISQNPSNFTVYCLSRNL